MMHKRADVCNKCYWQCNTSSSYNTCDRYYILGVGHRRNCPEGLCDKFLRRDATDEEIEANAALDEVNNG